MLVSYGTNSANTVLQISGFHQRGNWKTCLMHLGVHTQPSLKLFPILVETPQMHEIDVFK